MPWRASSAATNRPEGPAPMITMSFWVMLPLGGPNGQELAAVRIVPPVASYQIRASKRREAAMIWAGIGLWES